AFDRDTPVETGNAILNDEPRLPARAPPHLQAVVRRCLEKRPQDRFQTARDLAQQLDTRVPAARTTGLAGLAAALLKRLSGAASRPQPALSQVTFAEGI